MIKFLAMPCSVAGIAGFSAVLAVAGTPPGGGTPSKNVFSHLLLVSVLQPTITSVPQMAARVAIPRWGVRGFTGFEPTIFCGRIQKR
jgi:hypothetical protein